MSDVAGPEAVTGVSASTPLDEIKRTTGPHTANGRRWEVALSGVPPREWLELFKASGEATAKAVPKRVEFDRATAIFKCEEGEVAHWIESIDKWIASTNSRYRMSLEKVWRERFDRADAETKEKDRIEKMNDRFRNL